MRKGAAEGASDQVMHSRFSPGSGAPLFGLDLPEATPDPGPGGRFFAVHGTPGAARTIFDALAERGEAPMSFGPTFFSEGFGMVTDRWGTTWMISVQSSQAAPAGGDLEAARRGRLHGSGAPSPRRSPLPIRATPARSV